VVAAEGRTLPIPSEGLIGCNDDSQTSEPRYNARADGPAFGLLLAAQAAAALLTARQETR
jgi:hypothetical protein